MVGYIRIVAKVAKSLEVYMARHAQGGRQKHRLPSRSRSVTPYNKLSELILIKKEKVSRLTCFALDERTIERKNEIMAPTAASVHSSVEDGYNGKGVEKDTVVLPVPVDRLQKWNIGMGVFHLIFGIVALAVGKR
jgi:hypothetical protein